MMLIKKIKKQIFYNTVKTPVASLTIIFLIAIILISLLYSTYVDKFFNLEGEIVLADTNDLNSIYIKVFVNNEYLEEIKKGNSIIWYIKENNERYIISIEKIESIEGTKGSLILAKPNSRDITNAFGVGSIKEGTLVNIDIKIAKERVVDRLFKNK